jgi:hypothetical protein
MKYLLVLLLLALSATASAGEYQEVKYKLKSTIAYRAIKVVEFTPKGNKGILCVAMFVEKSEKAGLSCFKKDWF